MPLPTLWSESLLRISGSRLRKSARSPKVTDPPALGGPVTSWLEPPPPPQAATTNSAAASRIPIIDDEDRILQFVARGLRGEGYEVDVCADPHTGLEAAQTGAYDLVILDLLMPTLPGITVLDRLIQRQPRQVVIVLSCL